MNQLTGQQIVSATEAKNRLGAILAVVSRKNQEIAIESRGEPKAVIISYQEYEKLTALKEKERREEALKKLEELRKVVRTRSKDITREGKAIKIADRITRLALKRLVKKGMIRFKK